MIASRKLTVDQLFFRLSALYQPGGSAERTKLLHMLTDGKDSTDKSTNAYKIDCHRILHQTKFLEWVYL
jgi:predicted transcriptional regulator